MQTEDRLEPVMSKLQIHIVARVGGMGSRPLRYQQLATVLHEFLAGVAAVETCSRLLEIFSSSQNREPLRQDLRLAGVTPASGLAHISPVARKGKEPVHQGWVGLANRNEAVEGDTSMDIGPSGEELRQQFNRPPPFPFILTCLLVGSSLDPDAGEFQRPLEQPHEMPFDGTVNQGVFLLLDITDPEKCQYAFLHAPWEDEHVLPDPINQPLSARDYLLAGQPAISHGHFFDKNSRAAQVVDQLQRFRVLGIECMIDLWPWHLDWQPRIDDQAPRQSASIDLKGNNGPVVPQHTSNRMSLKSMAFDKAVDAFFASPTPDSTLFDQVRKMPDFQDCLVARLEMRAGLVVENLQAGIELLKLAFHSAEYIDLGPYVGLHLDVIIQLLQSPGIQDAFSSLSIPAGALTTTEDIDRLDSALPAKGIARLYIPQLPNLHEDTVFASAAFHIMGPKVHKKLCLGSAFSHGIHGVPWLDDESATDDLTSSVNTRSENGVSSQPIEETKARRASPKEIAMPIILSGGFHATPRSAKPPSFNIEQLIIKVDAYTEERLDTTRIETIYLKDALLTPLRFATGLVSLLCLRTVSMLPTDNGLDAAFCFSGAPSSLDPESQAEIGPLSAETHALGSRSCTRALVGRPIWAQMRGLRPDTWTAVVVQEQSQRFLRRTDADDEDALIENFGLRSRARFFRVAMVRARPGTIIPARSQLAEEISVESFESLSLEEFLRLTTGSTEGYDTVVNDLTKLAHEMWKASIGGRYGQRHGFPEAASQRPVLSDLLPEDVCQVLKDALVEVDEIEADLARAIPKCGHRACSCRGRRYMGR